MSVIRTCVGCRRRVPRGELLRVVVDGSAFVFDLQGNKQCRGSWVHDTFNCLNKTLVRGALFRALKVATTVDTTNIENRLKLSMDNS